MTSLFRRVSSLRRATPRDATAIKALIDHYVPSGTLLSRSEDFIVLHAQDFIVATAADDIVGCVHLDEYAPSLSELRSLAVHPDWQGAGIGRLLVDATEQLARKRGHITLFAVSNDEEFFHKFGFETCHIPELDLERSEVSRYKGVYAKDLISPSSSAPVKRHQESDVQLPRYAPVGSSPVGRTGKRE